LLAPLLDPVRVAVERGDDELIRFREVCWTPNVDDGRRGSGAEASIEIRGRDRGSTLLHDHRLHCSVDTTEPTNDGRHSSASSPSAAYLPEIVVEIVEHLGAARDLIRIILRSDGDALDERSDTRDLGAAEFVVLEVDVVDDLGDGAERRLLERGA